ncbi:type II toxin-antitoxin system VapC family toxin [bacterium]|nr:type II toxin-antitoxin system VapC family toxin [bacterium]MBU1638098.1 type II toxin-antitoxin system VapC family toxin [bacterium]MBU1920627.1 type II toxin-antitoxin system VapC family toxin [bacterium]
MIKCIGTTILLHAVDKLSPLHDRAVELLQQAERQEWMSCVCYQSLARLTKIATDPNRCKHPLGAAEMEKVIDAILRRPLPVVLYPDDNIFRRTLRLMVKYPAQRGRFIETHIAATALAHGVKTVVTADSAGFQAIREIEVENPFETLFA